MRFPREMRVGANEAIFALLTVIAATTVAQMVAGVERRRELREVVERRLGKARGREGPAGFSLSRFFTRDRRRGLTAGELSQIALEVAASLRAGAPLDQAWERTWRRSGGSAYLGLTEDGAPKNLLPGGVPPSRLPWGNRDDVRVSDTAGNAIVAACRFSFEVGAPLAEVLELVVEGINQVLQSLAAQRRAFTGPQLSANVLTALPVGAVFGGELLGFGGTAWLLGTAAGRVALLVGVGLLAAGRVLSFQLIRRAREEVDGQLDATFLCDLARSGLTAGVSIPGVLGGIGAARGDAELSRIAKELVMDADWEEVWDPLPAQSALLERGLRASWEEGISPLRILAHLSAGTRERAAEVAEEQAGKLAVKLVVPLGLFLLPAFVVLGVLPVVVSLFGEQPLG